MINIYRLLSEAYDAGYDLAVFHECGFGAENEPDSFDAWYTHNIDRINDVG